MHFSFQQITFGYRRSGPLVLDGFSWSVPPGRTVLLGPNGAGKSTLLGLGADALRPITGHVRVGGLQSDRRSERAEYRRTVGWMPQQIRPIPGLTAREQVAYAGWLKGLSSRAAWNAAGVALEQVGLAELADRKVAKLSGGQQRRVGLGQVLVHDAGVLLLDEPTVGLDPAQRARFREVLAGLPAERPVVVSTHQVDDLSEVFDTVVVLDGGVIRFEGAVESFLELAPENKGVRQAEAAYATLVGGDR